MKIFFSLCLPQTLIQAPIQKTIRAQLSHKKTSWLTLYTNVTQILVWINNCVIQWLYRTFLSKVPNVNSGQILFFTVWFSISSKWIHIFCFYYRLMSQHIKSMNKPPNYCSVSPLVCKLDIVFVFMDCAEHWVPHSKELAPPFLSECYTLRHHC